MDIKKASATFGLAMKAIAILGSLMGVAHAALITPTFDRFGPLTDATWGGSGIPNNAVAITQYNNITLGLSSHGRYENLSEGNNGAGTFFASAGSNTPPSSSLQGATWNFNFFATFDGDYSLSDYVFNLYYDFDPAVGNAQSSHGIITLNNYFNRATVQGSQNLLFGFLTNPLYVTAPTGSFNPNAAGEYTFALTVSDSTSGLELGRSAMRVVVNSDVVPVPEPTSLILISLGLLLLRLRTR